VEKNVQSIIALVTLAAAVGGVACSDEVASPNDPNVPNEGVSSLPLRMVVTADFLNRSLSVLDYDQLITGASRDDALSKTIDLADYAPGPLQVELTPDGSKAVVAVGPGFFDQLGIAFGFGDVAGEGSLLVVDLESGTVTGDITTASAPMGIAISPDGTRAYSANYGINGDRGETLSIIDIGAGTLVDEIVVGPGPEQVSLSSDGTLGIFNTAGDGSVRTFETVDPAGTLSEPLVTSGDPSDVAFVDGTDSVVVANSQSDAGFSIVDVSVPSKLVLGETVKVSGGIPYAATHIPGTTDVLVSKTGRPAKLMRVDVTTSPANPVEIPLPNEGQTFPLGVAVDPLGEFAFVGLPVENTLAIIELSTTETTVVPWLAADGPTYVAVVFRDLH